MCTLAVAIQADRRWPLVVAANRDERLHRDAEGWGLRDGAGGSRFAAPRDLLAGGTWIGLSARGMFAGLTNYHAPLEWYPDSERRSRGEIVGLALGQASVDDARRALSVLDPATFNPFHLVVADAGGAFLWWYDGERAGMEPLGPGLHLVTESSPHGDGPRGDLVRSRWPVDLSASHLREVMAIHASDPGARTSTCIHMDPVYGTRSSVLLRLAADLASSELLVADGPPCRAPFEDRGDLVAALARSA